MEWTILATLASSIDGTNKNTYVHISISISNFPGWCGPETWSLCVALYGNLSTVRLLHAAAFCLVVLTSCLLAGRNIPDAMLNVGSNE
jgi:putative exporter of polyketide antibiotics